jgi:aspartyl-tRNA(Asn)/glutamyl-tRNA(Gln) amidotransferase subunit A
VAVSPDLAGLTIAAASKELAARRLSAVELVEGTLAAVDRDNERLNAYLHVDREGALAAARGAEAALDDGSAGPLAGIPICVKDVIHVAGMPTTAGSSGWSRLPAADAAAVARLREAGAVIVGKGNTNEFAFGIDGRNPHRGDCRNPRDPTRISGGSSAGPAVATGAGLALGGLGTDTSGSLRVPASLCGLVAVRPTHGLVPTGGVVPLAWSYDTVGPLARTVGDAALLLEVIAGPALGPAGDAGGDPPPDLRGRTVGLMTQFVEAGCDPEIAAATRAAAALLESLGAEVRPVELPRLEHIETIHTVIQFAEAAAVHRQWIDDQRPRYEPAVLDRLEAGAALAATDYLDAQRARGLVRVETARAIDGVDALIAPATPIAAPPLDADTVDLDGRPVPVRPALLSFTLPLSQLGTPVVAIPLGMSAGLPFGLQITGRPGTERSLLALAAAYRRAAGVGEP